MMHISWRRSTLGRWATCSNKLPLTVCATRFGKSKRETPSSARRFPSVCPNALGKSRLTDVHGPGFASLYAGRVESSSTGMERAENGGRLRCWLHKGLGQRKWSVYWLDTRLVSLDGSRADNPIKTIWG